MGVSAIVLAGGASSRFGSDKLRADLHGRTVLDRTLDAVATINDVVVVGPHRATARTVRWTREEPPGGGPVAALRAAVPLVEDDLVLVLAGDLPLAGPAVSALLDAKPDGPTDVTVAVDDQQVVQPLLALWRTSALRRAVDAVAVPTGRGRSVRSLYDAVCVRSVAVTGSAVRDVDTEDDLCEMLRNVEHPHDDHCPAERSTAMDADASTLAVDVVERFNDAFNAHDLDAVMAMTTPTCVFDGTTPPDGDQHTGTDAVRTAWQALFDASPNATFTAEETFASEDRVVVRWRYDWIDDAGARGHVRGVDLFRIEDGLVAEKFAYVKG